jgi:hypothetical protein
LSFISVFEIKKNAREGTVVTVVPMKKTGSVVKHVGKLVEFVQENGVVAGASLVLGKDCTLLANRIMIFAVQMI